MTFSTLLANIVPTIWNFFWNMKEIFLVTKDKHSSCFSRSVPLLKSLHYFHDLNKTYQALSSTQPAYLNLMLLLVRNSNEKIEN